MRSAWMYSKGGKICLLRWEYEKEFRNTVFRKIIFDWNKSSDVINRLIAMKKQIQHLRF